MKNLLKRIEENKGMIYGKDILTVMSIMERKGTLTSQETAVKNLIETYQKQGK